MTTTSVKTKIRDWLPPRLQVPAKYWFGFLRRSHEPELGLMKDLIAPGDVVVDIGGNRGLYAYVFAHLGAHLHVFEPNPHCYRVLAEWAETKKAVSVFRVALSNNVGKAHLHIPVDDSGEAHDAAGSLDNASGESVQTEIVETQRLDDFNLAPTFIKIDVEGHECKVINGAQGTIRKHQPVLLVEIEQRHNPLPILEVFDQILVLGYNGYFLLNERLCPLKDFLLAQHQSAQAFARGHGHYVNNFLFFPINSRKGKTASFIRRHTRAVRQEAE